MFGLKKAPKIVKCSRSPNEDLKSPPKLEAMSDQARKIVSRSSPTNEERKKE